MDTFFFRFITIHAFDRKTDRQTDGQTPFSSLVRASITCSAERAIATVTFINLNFAFSDYDDD